MRNCTNLAKIPHNDRISTQDETKTKNGLFCMVVAILAYKGEPLRKKTLRAAGLPETVHIVRLFPQLKETAGLAMAASTGRESTPTPQPQPYQPGVRWEWGGEV